MRPYYEDEYVTLYHGDCREVMNALSVDCEPYTVITDPPYGIGLASHGHRFRSAREIAGDATMLVAEEVLARCIANGWCVIAFASPYRPWPGKWRNVLAWDKGEQVGIGGDRETCWKRTLELVMVANNPPLNGPRDGAVLRFPADVAKATGHVAEKPLDLMQYLIAKVTGSGDVVLDPFAGSGATLVAAKNIGRRAVGIEIEERYCDVIARRLSQNVLDFGGAA